MNIYNSVIYSFFLIQIQKQSRTLSPLLILAFQNKLTPEYQVLF